MAKTKQVTPEQLQDFIRPHLQYPDRKQALLDAMKELGYAALCEVPLKEFGTVLDAFKKAVADPAANTG